MSSLKELIRKVGLKTFPKGGIHPEESKELSKDCVIETPPPPQAVVIPLQQHIGAPAKAVVNKKDVVRKGQLIGEAQGFISANIHATIGGTVKSIDTCPSPITGRPTEAITIENDGDDSWAEGCNEEQDPWSMDPKAMVQLVHGAGIVGMGGATFPTHVKLSPPPGCMVEHAIINAVECESYITSDYRLMMERAADIVESLKLIMKIVGAPHGHIGVESNKPDAFEALARAAEGESGVEVHLLQVKYPQGAEHQLIKALTGREIPSKGGLPSAIGCLVHNVATGLAIRDAVRFKRPLIDRVVTLTGEGLENPANQVLRFGTSVEEALTRQGIMEGANKLIMGGPMMGIAQAAAEIPTIKGTNSILLLKDAAQLRMRPCIRCGRCVEACPYGLAPSEISILCESEDWDRAMAWDILECKECGCCTFVCPAKRKIVHLVKFGKAELNRIKREKQAREQAAAK